MTTCVHPYLPLYLFVGMLMVFVLYVYNDYILLLLYYVPCFAGVCCST
jgi:hypothetical protein